MLHTHPTDSNIITVYPQVQLIKHTDGFLELLLTHPILHTDTCFILHQ